eukprot:3196377-Alexandrium_andersonii.AAC.1
MALLPPPGLSTSLLELLRARSTPESGFSRCGPRPSAEPGMCRLSFVVLSPLRGRLTRTGGIR